MMAIVVLLLGIAVLGIIFAVLRFLAALTVVVLATCLLFILAAYGFSFLGLYFILGASNQGWAIFGAMGIGTLLLVGATKLAKTTCNALMARERNFRLTIKSR